MFIFLPISHEQQNVQRLPWITFGLIALNVIVFFLTTAGRSDTESSFNQKYDYLLRYQLERPYLEFPQSMREYLSEKDNEKIDLLKEAAETTIDPLTLEEEQEELDGLAKEIVQISNNHPFRQFGYIPGKPKVLALITCMFLHAGYMHLIGNMLFLFLAGCAIEDVWGRPLFIAFYFVSGIVATISFQIASSNSMVALVGASGAVAGLMGAFLIRLAKTQIRFFYLLFLLFFGFRTGTFNAPAYLMLPLWFLQQVVYASFHEGEGGVAFSAHIGGFVFGAAIALVMKFTQVEEKFIAPSIERKVSLEQNPLFLKGVQLAESKDYTGALIHLQKVVREDPSHFEAFMEMRRIAELNQDSKSYNRNMAGIFDLLLRNRDYDLFVDLYTQYKDHPYRDLLPARTLMSIALFFEENGDIPAAMAHLEMLVEKYSDDQLTMKAHSKLARLYLEKLDDRVKAIGALREAYFHSQSTQDWRSGLTIEMKKYGLTVDDLGRVTMPSTPQSNAPKVPISVPIVERNEVAQPAPVIAPAQKAPVKSAPEPMMIPSISFDGTHEDWNVVPCRIEKIGLKGVILSNQSKTGLLPWKRIRAISVTSVKHASPSGNELVIDLVVQQASDQTRIVYRVIGAELKFDRIFPRVEQSFEEAYQNLIGILIKNSGARCVPDRNRVTGPNFLVFPSISEYEVFLQQQTI